MKKKIVIGIIVLVMVLMASAVTYAVSSGIMSPKKAPSDYKVGVPYDTAMKGDKPVVALFYADWCGYCLKFMPRFKTLESLYKNKYNFLMINVEDPARADIVQDVALTGYPTVYIIDPKYDNRFLINNGIYMDLLKFRAELDRYIRIRIKLDGAALCE